MHLSFSKNDPASHPVTFADTPFSVEAATLVKAAKSVVMVMTKLGIFRSGDQISVN